MKTYRPQMAQAKSEVSKFSAPETVLTKSTTKEIRANSFVVEDANGVGRATLAMTELGPALRLADENDRTRATLDVSSAGPWKIPALSLWDENGRPRITLFMAEEPAVTLSDKNGKNRASLSIFKQNPSLELRDENETERVRLDLSKEGLMPGLSGTDVQDRIEQTEKTLSLINWRVLTLEGQMSRLRPVLDRLQ